MVELVDFLGCCISYVVALMVVVIFICFGGVGQLGFMAFLIKSSIVDVVVIVGLCFLFWGRVSRIFVS